MSIKAISHDVYHPETYYQSVGGGPFLISLLLAFNLFVLQRLIGVCRPGDVSKLRKLLTSFTIYLSQFSEFKATYENELRNRDREDKVVHETVAL